MAKILIACERFGAVRDAFIRKGHDAISCDIEDTEAPGPHIKGHLEDVIGDGSEWDCIIAFPPCTYLCSSGLHWNKRRPERAEKTEYALKFVCMIMNAIKKCGRGALENPIGCISTRIHYSQKEDRFIVLDQNKDKKYCINPAQIIQPYDFGHDASKTTCLYLYGLPRLKATEYIQPRIVNGKKRWANQTDSGQNRLGPSDTRAAERGKTYQGIADAMADQWSEYLENHL